jgi:propanol-preferring alcohol dehydrogenase
MYLTLFGHMKLIQIGPNELLLKLNATGICYSDLHYMMEDLGLPSMNQFNVRSAGHEGAGVVVKVGRDVKNWKVGDRGGVKPVWDVCGECELCWDGMHETYCSKAVLAGLAVPGKLIPQLFSRFHQSKAAGMES